MVFTEYASVARALLSQQPNSAYTFTSSMVSWKATARIGFVVAFGLGLAGCGGSPSETVTSGRQAIIGGVLDTEHTSVFGMVMHSGGGFSSCSATLIAPNLLLTARHCVSEGVVDPVICGRSALGATFAPESVVATNAAVFARDVQWLRAAEVHVPSEGADTCGFDVALVVLGENVPAEVTVPAVPRIDRDVAAGEVYVAVGYGIDDLGSVGDRRVRGGLTVACEPGSCGYGVRVSEFVGETGVCPGDSGGPALDQAGKVVGVVSRGAEDCSTPIYSTVTTWRALITEVAIHAASLGGYEAPFWVTSGVSDPPAKPAEIGEPCQVSTDCASGAACFLPVDGAPSTCTKSCVTDADCGTGSGCEGEAEGGLHVCLERPAAPAEHHLESTCSFAAPRPTGNFAWIAALGVGLAIALRRGRRVEPRGIEPLTSALRTRRSPS
jgi:V8-like Glu-specific endopeptidase